MKRFPSPSALAALEARLLDLLIAHPAGLSEHELLKRLRASDPFVRGFQRPRTTQAVSRSLSAVSCALPVAGSLGPRAARPLRVDPLGVVLEFEALPCGGTALAPSEPDFAPCYANLARLATMTITEVAELLRYFHAASAGRAAKGGVGGAGSARPDRCGGHQTAVPAVGDAPSSRPGGDGQRLGEINAAIGGVGRETRPMRLTLSHATAGNCR